ncbi:phage tail protein [Parasegetibacter sp. NRK P23]|uniref:phage tail protein n=1 Tax=Parasegetibacter sp. NRK P23 TaxID=2942999 RepID=UPI00204386B0|nr:phage tail protein [Parasegetibacter sp. NRK P23]MCM5528969.1 phage tail protein [Parasegetibacter sp. NRK P23]
MFFAQLGTTEYKGAFTFNSYSEDEEAIIVEHPLIGRKARLQQGATGLRTIAISLFLHQEYCNVEAEIKKLRASKDSFEILPLLWGNGAVEGEFIIASIGISKAQMDDTGNTISSLVNISLKENVVDDKRDQQQQQAKKDALAVGNKKTPSKSNRINPSTCSKQSIDIISVIKANSGRVDTISRQYTNNPALNSKLMSHLKIISNSAQMLVDATNNSGSCLFNNTNIRGTATNVKNRADSLKAIVHANAGGYGSGLFTPDITGVKTGNTTLQSAVRALDSAANTIRQSSITRK